MKTKKTPINKAWVVYILRCRDNTLYTGITNNLEKRLIAHNQGVASKYTRTRLPTVLAAISDPLSKSEALRMERIIKKMPKGEKIAAASGI
jgi:putative endonuclease